MKDGKRRKRKKKVQIGLITELIKLITALITLIVFILENLSTNK